MQRLPRAAHPLSEGMVDENPLAFVTRMRERGGPGAYAMASQVTTACREALGTLSKSMEDAAFARAVAAEMARVAGSSAQLARFQVNHAAALQRLEGRCRPLGTELASESPKSDDPSGLDYVEAQQAMMNRKAYPLQGLLDLAAQGQLYSALYNLRNLPFFEGRRISDPQEMRMFMHAMNLAAFAATAPAGEQAGDLRVMQACLATGVCDGSFESAELKDWPPDSAERNAIKQMAVKMEAAFTSNDLSLFLLGSKKKQ